MLQIWCCIAHHYSRQLHLHILTHCCSDIAQHRCICKQRMPQCCRNALEALAACCEAARRRRALVEPPTNGVPFLQGTMTYRGCTCDAASGMPCMLLPLLAQARASHAYRRCAAAVQPSCRQCAHAVVCACQVCAAGMCTGLKPQRC